MRSNLALLFLLVLVYGCAGTPVLVSVTPQQSQGQETVYSDGVSSIVSHGGEASVWASTVKDIPADYEYLEFSLKFSNRSLISYDIEPESFSIVDQNQRELQILSPEEHAAVLEQKLKAKSQRVDLSMQGFGSAYQNSGSIGGDVYSGSGNYSQGGSLSQADVQRNIHAMEATMESEIKAYLGRHTLTAGQEYAGKLWVAVPADRAQDGEILLRVSVAGEEHTFRFLTRTSVAAQ